MSFRLPFRSVLPALLLAVFAPALPAQPVVAVLGIAEEVAPIESRLEHSREQTVRGYVFRIGALNGRQVVVGRSGAGKVNAAIVTTLLIGHFNPSAILFSGTAGAIDPALRPGDVVIGASVGQHDVGLQSPSGIVRHGLRNAVSGERDPVVVPAPERLLASARRAATGLSLPPVKTAEGERAPRIVEGLILTGDAFLTDAARRDELRQSLAAAAVEMEGAAMVQTCRQWNVPCLVVRSITDRADKQAVSDYEQNLEMCSRNAAALVVETIGRLDPESPR